MPGDSTGTIFLPGHYPRLDLNPKKPPIGAADAAQPS